MKRALDDERRVARLLILPSFGFLALLALLPLTTVGWLSLRRHLPIFDVSRFVGLENYAYLLGDARFRGALWNTCYVTAISVTLEVVLGLAIALVLHQRFFARGAVRAVTLLPWALPTVVAAWMWEWILNPGLGILNHALGIEANWLGDPALAIHAVILVEVWKTTPFAAILLLAGLQTVPNELLRAAHVDGAGPLRAFRSITLPLLVPALLVVTLFRALDAFRVFDTVYVLTGGGPANTTETLSVYAYELYFQTLQFGTGSAVSMLAFLLMGLFSLACVLLARRRL